MGFAKSKAMSTSGLFHGKLQSRFEESISSELEHNTGISRENLFQIF
jgi:hypothetical protein